MERREVDRKQGGRNRWVRKKQEGLGEGEGEGEVGMDRKGSAWTMDY